MGVSQNAGIPIAGWFISWKSSMIWGTPIKMEASMVPSCVIREQDMRMGLATGPFVQSSELRLGALDDQDQKVTRICHNK